MGAPLLCRATAIDPTGCEVESTFWLSVDVNPEQAAKEKLAQQGYEMLRAAFAPFVSRLVEDW